MPVQPGDYEGFTHHEDSEIIVEIAAPKNRNVMFGPLRQKLRGRWDRTQNGAKSVHQSFAEMPDIPGIRLFIDTKRDVVGLYDPLALGDGQKIMERYDRIHNTWPTYVPQRKPWPPQIIEDKAVIKTWLYEVRKLVDRGRAIIVRGMDRLPSLDEIEKLSGPRGRAFFNSSADANKTVDNSPSGRRQRARSSAGGSDEDT